MKVKDLKDEQSALISENERKFEAYEERLKSATEEKAENTESCDDDSEKIEVLEAQNRKLINEKRKVIIAGIEVGTHKILSLQDLRLLG